MDTVKIPLSRRYEVPGTEPFDTIELRAPTYAELYMSGVGRPFEYHPVNGGTMVVRSTEVVDRYAQLLITKPGYEYIAGISARDGMRIEAAINGFFLEPMDVVKPPDGSSSDGASQPQTSSE
jgi:hypothetical protein